MKISKYCMIKRNIARLEREIVELTKVMEAKGMSVAGYQGVCLGGGSYNGEYHELNIYLRGWKQELSKIRFNLFSRIPIYVVRDYE